MPARRQFVLLLAYLVMLTAVVALLFSSITADRDRRQLLRDIEMLEEFSAKEVQEHREANQADHDCIVALALLLADPERPRDREVVPPSICRVAPANVNVESTEEPR